MAGHEWKVQEFNSCSVHETGLQYPLESKEIGSNANEVIDLLARGGQAGKEQTLPFSMSLYGLPADHTAQVKCLQHRGIFLLQISGIEVELPSSN